MIISADRQQQHVGTYLSYNTMLLRRDLGLSRNEFTTANMGGYAWSRMGVFADTDSEDGFRKKRWDAAKRQILAETEFLLELSGLEDQMKGINLDTPDGLWRIADIDIRPLAISKSGSVAFNKIATPAPNDMIEHRLGAKIQMMQTQYKTDPARITIGQLVLYGKEFPAYFNLTGNDDQTKKQWDRMTRYMAKKGYPDLQPEPDILTLDV